MKRAAMVLLEEWKEARAEPVSLHFKPPWTKMAIGSRNTYGCNFLGRTKLQMGSFRVTEVKLTREKSYEENCIEGWLLEIRRKFGIKKTPRLAGKVRNSTYPGAGAINQKFHFVLVHWLRLWVTLSIRESGVQAATVGPLGPPVLQVCCVMFDPVIWLGYAKKTIPLYCKCTCYK